MVKLNYMPAAFAEYKSSVLGIENPSQDEIDYHNITFYCGAFSLLQLIKQALDDPDNDREKLRANLGELCMILENELGEVLTPMEASNEPRIIQ